MTPKTAADKAIEALAALRATVAESPPHLTDGPLWESIRGADARLDDVRAHLARIERVVSRPVRGFGS